MKSSWENVAFSIPILVWEYMYAKGWLKITDNSTSYSYRNLRKWVIDKVANLYDVSLTRNQDRACGDAVTEFVLYFQNIDHYKNLNLLDFFKEIKSIFNKLDFLFFFYPHIFHASLKPRHNRVHKSRTR